MPISTPAPLQSGESQSAINVDGIEISWNTRTGGCTFRDIPVAMMWIDSTLAGLMSGVASMVGPERFSLALQAEGRKSVESDWLLIQEYADFSEGFAQLNLNAKVAGWGDWQLVSYSPEKKQCVFRAFNNWEGAYQKALGVCWGSGMLAGKLAGICGKLFGCNCWATQTHFVAKGHAYDEFVVSPSARNLEAEIENLLLSDQATRADMAVALQRLENTQRVLQESEQRYAQLIRNIPDGIYSWQFGADGNMGFIYVSPRFCHILGLDAAEVLKNYRLAFDAVHPDDLAGLEQRNEYVRTHITPFRWEGRFIVHGRIRWISLSSDPILRADGGSIWHGVVRDVTALKSAAESQRLAALVYSNSREGMLVTNAANRIVSVNPAFSRLTGYAAEEALGQNPNFMSSGKHDLEFYQEMWHSLYTTGQWEGEIWNRRKNGEIYPEWLKIDTIFTDDGQVSQRVALFTDITEKKRSEATIWRQANFDPLTGLPNRSMFLDLLERELKRAEREESKIALLFMDLDHFKDVNDTLGHQVGDELLKMAAKRLQRCVREADTVARLGGDEFTAVLTHLNDGSDILRVVRDMIECVAKPFYLGEQPAYISVSIGITVFPDDGQTSELLFKQADQAMYAAKKQGRNRFCFFTASLQHEADQRLQLTRDLHAAIDTRQFEVHYQPIVELQSGCIVKAEALLRWNHPTCGYIDPAQFLPVAEECLLIQDIDDWVFKQAMSRLKEWRHLTGADFQISVNQSPAQFKDSNRNHAEWQEGLMAMDTDCKNVVVEITESLLLENHPTIRNRLLRLRAAGAQIAIDDFGTGYSALSYLNKFPIDYLKIDNSFIRDLTFDATDFALSKAIVSMAHALGLKVIAEGVETRDQLALLVEIGCDYGQGFLFAKPLPAPEFEKLFKNRLMTDSVAPRNGDSDRLV
ncbi:EAL domain-containing protein [Methylomonas rhizoryzae]|uniref:EAL domain-containing protein n=1 Tax=Methylomonas rhizoryzae TaxID=2608981 RepID=UPI0012319BEB|nr:EAL domain-containing protein [Methylomonas rhizoryzae]